MPRVRFDDLRHTTASVLLAEGVHAKVVASLLAQSTGQITRDTSSHVTPGLARQATEVLAALVANSGGTANNHPTR